MEKIPENKETERTKRKESILSKIRELTSHSRLFAGTISLGLLLCGIGGEIKKYYKDRPAKYYTATTTNETNKIEYVHEDPETTSFINALSGKEPISESLLRKMAIIAIVQEKKDQKEVELNKLSTDELIKKCAQLVVSVKIPGQKDFDPELYDALWKMHQKHGNPIIRFKPHKEVDRSNRSHYFSKENHLMLEIPYDMHFHGHGFIKCLSMYLSELSHASSDSDRPVETYVKRALDRKRVESESSRTNQDPDVVYDNILYDSIYSSEYLAHKKIEPALKRELEQLTPKRQALIEKLKKELKEIQYDIDRSTNSDFKEKYPLYRKQFDLLERLYDLEQLTVTITDLHPPKPTTKK